MIYTCKNPECTTEFEVQFGSSFKNASYDVARDWYFAVCPDCGTTYRLTGQPPGNLSDDTFSTTVKNMLVSDETVALNKYRLELNEIEQILGKVLNYPWFMDDLKNFPWSTEEDGVCVGDNTAASLAMEAATKIKFLRKSRNIFGFVILTLIILCVGLALT